MSRFPVHQPPPAPLVAELIRAGVSQTTAMAMERWKAQEVLDLLRRDVTDDNAADQVMTRQRGTI
jgi:hypothetical protein